MNKQAYIKPQIEVINLEVEHNIAGIAPGSSDNLFPSNRSQASRGYRGGGDNASWQEVDDMLNDIFTYEQ